MAQDAFYVTRKIKLSNLNDEQDFNAMKNHQAIKDVQIIGPQKISITYDLTRLDFEDVYGLLKHKKMNENWFTRLRHAYWTMSDQNLRANLKVPVHCCNKSPR